MPAPMLRSGRFEFDPASGQLRVAGAPVRLRYQSGRLLGLLLSRAGDVVTREELRAHLWDSETFVDFDQGLNHCIKEIRAALGDVALMPSFVETLPRRGYRWIAPLESPLESASGTGGPLASLRRPRGLAALAAAAALFLSVWVESSGTPLRASDLRWQRLTFQRGRIASARVMPGAGFAYVGAWDGRPARLETSGARWRAASSRPIDWLIGVTPTGQALTLHRGVLERYALPDGEPVVLARGVLAADVSRDGATIAVSIQRGDGPGASIELPLGRPVGRLANPSLHLRLSPDGRRLAVTDHPLRGHDGASLVVFDEAGRQRTLGSPWSSLQGVAWPSNQEVWITGSHTGADNALFAVDAVTGAERELLSGGGRLMLHDVATDGRVLLERTTQRMEMVFGRVGEPERNLDFQDGSYPVEMSDDGRLLLFGESGEAGGALQAAYVRTTEGSVPKRLATGRPLGFIARATGALVAPGVWPDRVDVVPVDASGPIRSYRAPGVTSFQWAGAFPGDPGRLLFVGAAGGRAARLYQAALDGGTPVPLTPEGMVIWRNTVSPDGARVVASCTPGTGFCVYPTGAEASALPLATLGGALPVRWDATGERLFVFERDGQRARVMALHPDGRREDLFSLSPRDPVGVLRINDLVLTPDGRAWVYGFLRRHSDLFVVRGLPTRPA